MNKEKALLVVDVQRDFCPGGTLAVPKGDRVVGPLNRYIKLFSKKKFPVFISRDWHPKNSRHFKKFGGLWPVHCVQDTDGARFHPKLKFPKSAVIISKGMDPKEKDAYSNFEAFDKKKRPFKKILKQSGVRELYIGGLATDYCVRASVLDALKNHLKVKLLTDAVRGVDVKKGDAKKAVHEMARRGAEKTIFKKTLVHLRRGL